MYSVTAALNIIIHKTNSGVFFIGDSIKFNLKRLGTTFDWDREYFTMDEVNYGRALQFCSMIALLLCVNNKS